MEGFIDKIIVMGRSLGSASACEIVSKHVNSLSGCIIESGFGTEQPLLDLLQIDPAEINFSTEDGFENLRKLSSYKKPILFIHADNDTIVPIREAHLMYDNVGSKIKSLFEVKGAGHNDILLYSRYKYFEEIKSFIDNT